MGERRRRPRRNRHYRIDHELSPTDLEAYREYLREPRTTNKSARAWLVARGYPTFSESAVARHKRHFLEHVAEDQQGLERARQWTSLARDVEQTGGDLIEGAVTFTELMACRALFDLDEQESVSDVQLEQFCNIVSRVVATRIRLTRLKREKEAAAGAGAGAGAAGRQGPAAATPATALTEEEREEAAYKKICELLDQPYLNAAQRAESKKKWEEFERRQAAEGGAPGNN